MRLFTPTILWMLLGKGSADKPDIIFILADDLGEKVKFSGDNVKWSFSPGVNDVGWNNPSSPTSHLDSLAEEGVILDSAYLHPPHLFPLQSGPLDRYSAVFCRG